MNSLCQFCGNPFEARKGQKYCSDNCRNQANLLKYDLRKFNEKLNKNLFEEKREPKANNEN